MYSVRNLTSGYGKNIILHDLTLDITPGLTSLIGPNGAGKSTFLRVLAGLTAYNGSVLLHGREVSSIPRREFSRYVGVVMSAKDFRPSYPFSVREVIAMGRLPYRGLFSPLTRNDSDIITRASAMMGISHLMERDIMTLSDGERQMTLIASALAQDTRILLLDEPTSSLDPDRAARVFALMRNLADDGRTIIAAVHDINISLSYSDNYIALRNGRIISHGAEINAGVLEELYGTKFASYRNDERNDSMWRALPE